jgi:pyruvate dehydrogenase (quinone)
MRRVADDLLDVLVAAGVHRIYGLVGDSLNALSDAVRRSGGAERGGVDVVTTSGGLEVPSHVREEDARGFALALAAMVVGEVLRIARLNVRDIPV